MINMSKEDLMDLVNLARADMQNSKDIYDKLLLRIRNERDMAYILLDEVEGCVDKYKGGGAGLLAKAVQNILAKRNRNQT